MTGSHNLGTKASAKNDDNTVRVDIVAKFDGQTVLGRPMAVVRLA